MNSSKRRLRSLLIALLIVALIGGIGLFQLFYLNLSRLGRNDGTIAFTYYPTARQLVSLITDLADQYHHLVSVETMGLSRRGQPLLGVTIAADGILPPSERPALLIDAQQHGRETISSQVALYAIVDLLKRHASDQAVQFLLSTRTIYYVPQMNPDGNDLFLTDNTNQRGNARQADLDGDGNLSEDGRDQAGLGTLERQFINFKPDWISSTNGNVFTEGWANQDSDGKWLNVQGYSQDYVTASGRVIQQLDNDGDGTINEDELLGVDLNRNWDVAWELGEGNPSSPLYRGSQPFSEPETVALRDFVLGHPNIVSALDVHSGAEIILMPWSKSNTDTTPDADILDQLARKGSQLTQAPHTVSSEGLYLAYGTIKDWLYQQGILTIAPEVYRGRQLSKQFRLWPSNWYVTFGSIAQQFNPSPGDIADSGERWKGFLQYMLAALPDANINGLSLDGRSLTISVGNSGLIPNNLQLELWNGHRRLWAAQLPNVTVQSKQASIANLADGAYRLLIDSQPEIKIKPHQPFHQELNFSISDGKLIYQEPLVDQVDVGRAFDGLTAPVAPYESAEWHTR